MKGVVFVALNQMIEEKYGIDFWEELVQRVQPASGAVYTSVGSYSDEEVAAYVENIADMSTLDKREILITFGDYLFDVLNRRFPLFTQIQPDIFNFLKSIECVIHKEVHKLYDDVSLPTLAYGESDSDSESVTLLYRSPRKLCYLAEGLIAGAARHYQFNYLLEHKICMHNGDDHCLFRVAAE